MQESALPYAIVYSDADTEASAAAIVKAAVTDRGNLCISTKKVLAPRSIAEALEKALKKAADLLVRGDPLDEATDVGALTQDSREYAMERFATADVFYDDHLVLARCDVSSPLFTEEIAFPVVGIHYHEDDQDPVAISNRAIRSAPSRRSLCTSVFTANQETFSKAAKDLRAFKVLHNRPSTEMDNMSLHQGKHLFLELLRLQAVVA